MDVRNTYTEALGLAAATLGGADRLARYLHVSRLTVVRWLAGEEAPPNQVFRDALEVIEDAQRERPRIAVLPPE